MSEWKTDMESAKRHGKTFLAVHKGSNEVIPVILSKRYSGPEGSGGLVLYAVEDAYITHGYAQWNNLTHWMPLPAPPQSKE